MSCIVAKDVCGITYYHGYRWEGLIDNAHKLTEQAAQKVAAEYERKGITVFIKVYNLKKK